VHALGGFLEALMDPATLPERSLNIPNNLHDPVSVVARWVTHGPGDPDGIATRASHSSWSSNNLPNATPSPHHHHHLSDPSSAATGLLRGFVLSTRDWCRVCAAIDPATRE
jgi:hypothetical protein